MAALVAAISASEVVAFRIEMAATSLAMTTCVKDKPSRLLNPAQDSP